MGVIDFKDLPRIREKHKNEKIAVCAGVFDLTHAGHILFFEDCKKYGDILVVVLEMTSMSAVIKGRNGPC